MDKQLNSKKVLVIDDEQNLRDGAERVLSRMNFKVFKASRGEEGLKILESEIISIVLLDMKMPGMDGMEVLKKIMEMDRGILVIIVTGYATVKVAIEAMKCGAYDFIPKPYEPDQLRIVINRASEKIQLTIDADKLEQEKKRTLIDLHTEKSRIYTIIESLPNGVVVTNTEGIVVLMNPAFKQHLCISPDESTGKKIEEYIKDGELCKLIMDISQGKYVDFEDIKPHELSPGNGKYLLARSRPVLGEKKECLGAVVNITDISAMKALDQFKSEFVAKVTHELRSPLSTIHEQLATVLKDMSKETYENDQHMLARAKEKTHSLISTIGDLLDLSRIEAGIVSKEPKQVHIDELLKNIIDFLTPQAKSKGQSITIEIPKDPIPTMFVDPIALESVFGNLIANAIKYTQEAGKIEVKVDMVASNLRVVIKDNGFGIEEKHIQNIFERFYRVKNTKTRHITGTGLGLSIVKGIIDSLGGYIDVESEFEKGSTFTVILPTKKPSILPI